MVKVGDKIRIIHLADEPYNSNYEGVEGKVTRIEIDSWGEERMAGTWGSIFVYLVKDDYEIID